MIHILSLPISTMFYHFIKISGVWVLLCQPRLRELRFLNRTNGDCPWRFGSKDLDGFQENRRESRKSKFSRGSLGSILDPENRVGWPDRSKPRKSGFWPGDENRTKKVRFFGPETGPETGPKSGPGAGPGPGPGPGPVRDRSGTGRQLSLIHI